MVRIETGRVDDVPESTPKSASVTPSHNTTAPDPDFLTAVLTKMEDLRREVLDLPCEILIPPERHDNRQKYAMYFVLERALDVITGDGYPARPLAEVLRGLNTRSRQEIERDNGADAELLTLCAEFEADEEAFLAAHETDQGAANDRVAAAATKIAAMPALTLPGLAAKLKVLANDADAITGPDWTAALITGAAADAERLALAGRAA
jgi:hypothetical protein